MDMFSRTNPFLPAPAALALQFRRDQSLWLFAELCGWVKSENMAFCSSVSLCLGQSI